MNPASEPWEPIQVKSMQIRSYYPGDEQAQARIYNTAARSFPGFKPTSPEEIARRYQSIEPDPMARLYAVDHEHVIGYVAFNPNGRISYPWCLPGFESLRSPLLDTALTTMRQRGYQEAWAAYRADWLPILNFLRTHGFAVRRNMINYVADILLLPNRPVPSGQIVTQLDRTELPLLLELGHGLFTDDGREALDQFFWENPYFSADGFFGLRVSGDGRLIGAALTIVNNAYADPTRIDAAMPCFRLGAFGTEFERHKRVNGMFSCVFRNEAAGEVLLSEAARRLSQSGLTHLAAQAPSDARTLCAFYDRFFDRQGEFPLMIRPLTD